MNLLVKFIFFVLICSSVWGHVVVCPGEVIQPRDEDVIEVLSELDDETVGEACIPHEQAYRDFVVQRIQLGNSQWRAIYDCESNPTRDNCDSQREAFDQYQSSVEAYRALNIHLHNQLASQWFQSLNEGQREHATNCFIDRENPDSGVQLGQHVRTLGVQNGLDPNLCIGLTQSFELQITSLESQARQNPSSVGMTETQISSMREFENSFGSFIMSDQTKGNPHFSTEQLRESLLEDMSFNIGQINQFSESISGLTDSRLDQLYQFENLYEQEFLPTLSEEDRELYSPRCKDASGWSTCYRNFIQEIDSRADYNRCMANLGTLALDFLPGYGIYDAYLSGIENRASLLSGVATEQEFNQRQNQVDLQLVLGIPILDLAGLGTLRVADNVLAGTIRNADEVVTRAELPQGILERVESFTDTRQIPGGAGGVQTAGINQGRFIRTQDIRPADLPYQQGLREVREPRTFRSLEEVPEVEVNPTDIVLTSREHSGSNGIVRLATLPDGRPVAIKAVELYRNQYDDAATIAARNADALLEDINGTELADALGIGPQFHGTFVDEFGRTNLVMDLATGDFPGESAGNITANTLREFDEMFSRISTHSGYRDLGDFQFYITNDGHPRVIDAHPLVSSTEGTAQQFINRQARERAELLEQTEPSIGIEYLRGLRDSSFVQYEETIEILRLRSRRPDFPNEYREFIDTEGDLIDIL
jgi:hypothetical protein